MRKENIKLSIIISLLVVVSLSTTYAFLELGDTNSSATGEGGCFEVSYSGNEISNISISSNANYAQGANTEITLSKDAECKIYTEAEIYLYTNPATTTAPIASVQALKYKILQGSTEIASGTITGTGDQLLTANPITLNDTATTYKVYLWIDPSLSLGYYDAKTYSGYIYAKSTQTSTIK